MTRVGAPVAAALSFFDTARRLVRRHAGHVARRARAAGSRVGRVVDVAGAAVGVAHGGGGRSGAVYVAAGSGCNWRDWIGRGRAEGREGGRVYGCTKILLMCVCLCWDGWSIKVPVV